MISNKTAATLLFITLAMGADASTSPRGIKRRRSPDKPVHAKKQKRPSGTRETVPVLQDTTNTVNPVEVQKESTEVIGTSQGQPVSQMKNQFKTLIEKGEYGKIFELNEKTDNEEFLKQLCPVIRTFGQYNGIVDHVRRQIVVSFYIHGDIEVVKEAIIESRVYDGGNDYVDNGDLETALPIALDEDHHDRVIELLDIRKGVTAEKDEQLKRRREPASFGEFVYYFLDSFAPWEDGMALRQLLIFKRDELRNKYREILDTLCKELVYRLRDKLDLPKAGTLLDDLIGQPSLLTPVVFARGFLDGEDVDKNRSNFIKYGWRETIEEGLKKEHYCGGKELWRVMQEEQPDQYPGVFPVTEEARAAACAHLPTKQPKEDEWIKKYFTILFNQLKDLDFLPTVLWSIISEYAVLFIAAMDLTFSI